MNRCTALLGAVVIMAATAVYARAESHITRAHECAFARSATCTGGVTDSPCGEVKTARGVEELTCCPGTEQLVHRLCVGTPGSMNECGRVGQGGCSICLPTIDYD